MSLNLAMNAAISGMMVSQRGLEVVSQNMANFQTPGYHRKVVNLESNSLLGYGNGVSISSVSRSVHEGLLTSIRTQNATMGTLSVKDSYYPRIEDMFGKIDSSQSLSAKLAGLGNNFQTLSDQVQKPSIHNLVVQGTQGLTQTITRMSDQLQALRAEADQEIAANIDSINSLLSQIDEMNKQITRAVAADNSIGLGDLEDQRDNAINELSTMMNIRSIPRGDGGIVIQLSNGQTLLDGNAAQLVFAANTVVESSMSVDSGNFDRITIENGTVILDDLITDGTLRGLLDIRDKDIPNLQANIDELSRSLLDTINAIHNQGTNYPNIDSHLEGTRTFGEQDGITEGADTTATITMGANSFDAAALAGLNFAYATNAAGETTYEATILDGAGVLAGFAEGDIFTISDANPAGNNGTYKVVAQDGAGGPTTVVKMNPEQTFSMPEGSDSQFILYGKDGKELHSIDIKTMMGDAGYDPSGPWTMNSFTETLQSWMRNVTDPVYDGQATASVSLNDDGKLVIKTGNREVGTAMRDQVDGTDGSERKPATVEFDSNGDGESDQTFSGLSSFFGLNDLFVKNENNSIWDSDIINDNYTTSTSHTVTLYDESGQVGNSNIMIPAGSSLEDIAARLNASSQVTESDVLMTDTIDLFDEATIIVSDTHGDRISITVGPGIVDLNEVAGQLNQNGVNATLVKEGNGFILRVTDSNRQPLQVTTEGGTITHSGNPLSSYLGMGQIQRIEASVINEGAGQRLRIKQADGSEVFISSPKDADGNNLLSELGLRPAAVGIGESISVREDILSAPEKISRGIMKWDEDARRYYMTDADNTTALVLAEAMSSKLTFASSGMIHEGQQGFSEYATTLFSKMSTDINSNSSSLSYESQLNESLQFQYSSYSGVNMDEEVISMMTFQRSYSSSAQVITTVQDMLDVLMNMIQ